MASKRTLGSRMYLGGVILFMAATTAGLGQGVSDYEVKAAYLYSFAKFVEWPQEKFSEVTSPILFCVLNDPEFESELNRVVKGKYVSGHSARVVSIEDAEQARHCHLLFLNSSRTQKNKRVLESLRGAAVLTVGEAHGFLQEGGIMEFVLQDNHVKFEVNRKAANQERLYISARLLGVARRVLE